LDIETLTSKISCTRTLLQVLVDNNMTGGTDGGWKYVWLI
jgi:hypothetical protein